MQNSLPWHFLHVNDLRLVVGLPDSFKISVWATWYQEKITVVYLKGDLLLNLLVINQVHCKEISGYQEQICMSMSFPLLCILYTAVLSHRISLSRLIWRIISTFCRKFADYEKSFTSTTCACHWYYFAITLAWYKWSVIDQILSYKLVLCWGGK